MPIEIDLKNTDETKQLGAYFGRLLRTPLVIFVHGQLGAGKTTLIQGFIDEVLPKKTSILSPTYAYMHRYEHTPLIFHFDLYRIENPEELFDLGLLECINNDQTLRLIEWPERLGFFYRSPHLQIELLQLPSGRRALIKPSENFPYSLTPLLMSATSTSLTRGRAAW